MNRTPRNGPKLNLFLVSHHWNGHRQPRTKSCDRYTQEQHKYHTKQLLELRHRLFEGFHPRNHSRLCLSTKRFITPPKIYTGTTQPNSKPEHNHLHHWQKRWRCNHAQRYVDKINSLLEDTNTYEIPNLTTINKDVISFNKLQKTRKENS